MHAFMILPFFYLIQFTTATLLTLDVDPIASEKYTINYVSSCRWDDLYDSSNSKYNGRFFQFGEDTQCFIPNIVKNSTFDNLRNSSIMSEDLLRNTIETGVKMISDTLDGYCIVYHNGFWTYRYCPGKDLVQLHNDTLDPQTLVYVLGKAEADIKDRDFQLLNNEVGYYISELLGMGDVCDVTGAHRLVDVQYVCGETHGAATIQWIRETKICQYVMQIALPDLCKLELLAKNEDKKTATQIDCVKRDNDLKKYDRNIIDLLAEFDPIFLGYGVYLLQPIAGGKRNALLYTDVLNNDNLNEVPRKVYDKFGKAINRLITQRKLSLSDGTVVVNGDSFTWMSEIFDINGTFITMLSIYVSPLGKAELILDNDLVFPGPDNFISYESKTGSLRELFESENDNQAKKQEKMDFLDEMSFTLRG